MKKRLLCLLFALGLAAALTACGGSGGSSAPKQPDSPAQPGQSASSGDPQQHNYAFPASIGGQALDIEMDMDMAQVLSALGEPQSYFEAASCAFDGLDKTYTYAGFTVITRPDGDKDYVNSVLLTDDSATTAEGIYIGSSLDDVTSAYGQADLQDGVVSYTRGNCTITFIFEENSVISIEYLPASA